MLKQDPLPTHDGRPGNRGSIVHVASQLGIVSRSDAGLYPFFLFLGDIYIMCVCWADKGYSCILRE